MTDVRGAANHQGRRAPGDPGAAAPRAAGLYEEQPAESANQLLALHDQAVRGPAEGLGDVLHVIAIDGIIDAVEDIQKEPILPVARIRTTVAIAEDVLAAVDDAIQEGLARSRNEFLETALKNQLAASRRAAIDAAFARMAEDADYQQEALEIAAEFESADRESLELAS